jgi:oligoendopeptidase F
LIEISRRKALLLSAATAAASSGAAWAQGAASAAAAPTVWDLTELYPNDAAWAAERDAAETALATIAPYRGRLGESAATLKAALQTISDLSRRIGRISVYASLKADENLQVAANQERRQLATALQTRFAEATSWVNPEVLAVGAPRINGFIAADPGLAKFRFGLDDTLRLAPHTLDASGEQLLASSNQPLSGAQEIRNQLFLSDIPWPEIQLSDRTVRLDSQGYTSARAAPVREDRKKVFDTFFGSIKTYESSLGAALTTQVQSNIFAARSRKYDSAVAASLAPANIPVSVYRTLVAEANAGLPVLHRYFEIRRRMLGLPDLRYFDIYPPVTKLTKTFDITETRRLTLEALRPLGPDYVDSLSKATAARWMHVYPQKGKRAGAYMQPGAYDVHPYLLLNHSDNYEGLSTFAHEWGHAMHSLLANKAQPYETAGYPIFTAEIASTCNEQLLADYMIRNARSKEEKLFYLDRICELVRGTFFRQTMFAEFELSIHDAAEKGDALSGERFTAMYAELLKRYHGAGMAIDDAYGVEWAFIPHFYYNFYVYQYATSGAASTYFADKILAGKAADREAFLNVLRAGGSDYPVEILRRAGLDMASPAPYRAIVAKLSRTLDQMEALIGKG